MELKEAKRICFNDKKPNYGDLIVLISSPEQMTTPYLTVFDRNTEWIDGDEWVLIKKG